jgi:hypothetical protein
MSIELSTIYTIILLLIISSLIGIFLIVTGYFKKKRKLISLGLSILIPFGFVVFCIVIYFIHDKFAMKPNEKDLVGTYKVVQGGIKIKESDYKKYRLEFKNDTTFILTQSNFFDICENGKYILRYDIEGEELVFDCDTIRYSVHIERNLNNFQIEIGDVIFEKIPTK